MSVTAHFRKLHFFCLGSRHADNSGVRSLCKSLAVPGGPSVLASLLRTRGLCSCLNLHLLHVLKILSARFKCQRLNSQNGPQNNATRRFARMLCTKCRNLKKGLLCAVAGKMFACECQPMGRQRDKETYEAVTSGVHSPLALDVIIPSPNTQPSPQ